jgi:tRNA threonylcarbamoyladenosine biosynthesis protein TsaE
MKFEQIYGLADLPNLVKELINQLEHCSIVVFKGSLGAGKTTLIKALLGQLGVRPDQITSPTFTYVNRYKLQDGRVCNHFDLYRLSNLSEFMEMGFDEYLNEKDAICLIEWPDVIDSLLKSHDNVCLISLEYCEDERRKLVLERY